MDARIMRTLAELIAEHHRNRWDLKTDQYSDFDTTVSHDEDKENPRGGYQAEGLGTVHGAATGIDP
jgi:hypothetical protein